MIRSGAAAAMTALCVACDVSAGFTFNTEILSLTLTGDGQYGPITITLTPGTHSTGQTTIAPDGTPGDIDPGNGQDTVIDSFFDVWFDISFMDASGVTITSSIAAAHMAINAPCENAPGLPPLPPGCMYMGHPIFEIEDYIAIVANHLPDPATVVNLPPLPGFQYVEEFNTTLFIETQGGPTYQLSGPMVVGIVPAPATLALLGILALSPQRRRIRA
jgi:hypothetical protein